MFKNVNDMFNEMKSDEANNKFIVESVIGDDVVPFSEDEDDDIVDSGSVDPKVIDQIDKILDKIVSDEDYNDDEIDELISDDDEEEIDAVLDSEDVNID